MNILSELNIRGHLTISKVFQDGSEDLIFDDKNMIVSGMGWALSHFFSRLGSTSIVDYQIDRFQLGVDGHAGAQVSSTYQLSGELSSTAEYVGVGTDSNLNIVTGHQWKNSVAATTSPLGNTIIFAMIPFSKVTRINETSIRYSIFIDEDSCNNLSRNGNAANLNEIGLFMSNPKNNTPDTSILVAYKNFSNIRKTSDFALLFRWTITFA